MIHRLARALLYSDTVRRLKWRQRLQIVLFVFPVLTLAAALIYALEAAVYVVRSEAVTGTVVQLYEWPGETLFDRGTVNYEPIFTYAQNGETRRASVGSAHRSFEYEIGETATIRAIPGDRGNVRLDTWQGLWFLPVILGALGLVTFVAAMLLWWMIRAIFFAKGQS